MTVIVRGHDTALTCVAWSRRGDGSTSSGCGGVHHAHTIRGGGGGGGGSCDRGGGAIKS
jgi:hypothetical protein